MGIKIIHNGTNVFFAKSKAQASVYMRKHHPTVKGYARNSIGNKVDVGEINGFELINIATKGYKIDRKIRTTAFNNFRDHKVWTFEPEYTITIETMYDIIETIIDTIRKKSKNKIKHSKYQVVFLTGIKEQTIGTAFINFDQLTYRLETLLKNNLNNYNGILEIIKIDLRVIAVEDDDVEEFDIYGEIKKKEPELNEKIETPEGFRIRNTEMDQLEKKYLNIIDGMEFNKKSNKKIIELFKGYIPSSPSTSKRCLATACYISRYNNENVIDKVKWFMKDYPDIPCNIKEMCSVLSGVLKRSIKVYYLDYDIREFVYGKDKYKEQIKILVKGSHAIGLIKKDDESRKRIGISSVRENRMIYELFGIGGDDENVDDKRTSDGIIENKGFDKTDSRMEDYKMAVFDLETCDNIISNDKKHDTTVYALGFYDGIIYKEIYKKDKDDNVLINFLNFLFDKYRQKKTIIYAHNGGKFDTFLLIKEIIKDSRFVITSFLDQSGRIINLSIFNYDKKKTIIFRDSINLIASSLDSACKSFKPKTVKLEGDVEHSKINIDNCCSKEIYKYTKKYLKNDCLSLYEILKIFDKTIESKYNFSIRSTLTNAGIARRLFLTKHNHEKYPIHRLPDNIDSELRKYYYGGRNECMTKLGYSKGKFYYVDFTSLYPYIMSIELFPYGELYLIKVNTTVFNKSWFGFVKCKFRHTHKNNIPLHAIVKDSKLVFPHCDNWQESIISTEEIRYSVENDIGYEYKFELIYNYEKKERYFDDIIDELYEMKLRAQKDGNKALRSIGKIIINSVYGFFGINYHKRDQNILVKEKNTVNKDQPQKTNSKIAGYLMSQKLKDYKKIGKYDLYSIEDKIKVSCANVGIASMVTSYARIELYKLLKDLKDAGGNIFYMDTDSVITDYNIYKDEKFKKKWIRSGGEKLGELTNETNQEGGYYKEIVTLGNKMYSLKNDDLKDEKVRRVIKLKGLNSNMNYDRKFYNHKKKTIRLVGINKFKGKKRITFDDYVLMDQGYKLTCDSMNFISGVNDMLYKGNGLIKMENKKSVGQLYDKADVSADKIITPIVV